MIGSISYTIPDPDAYNPLAHLNELANGDYKTGRRVSGYRWGGDLIEGEFEEIIVVRNHNIFGFRLPNGQIYVVPLPDDENFTPPEIQFPPLE